MWGRLGTTKATRGCQCLYNEIAIEKCTCLKSVVDGGPAIKDPKHFTRFALGMPGKGEMKQVIE